MGAPEVLIVAFVVGVPAALVWCAISLGRRRAQRRWVARWDRVEHLSPEDEEFWNGRNP